MVWFNVILSVVGIAIVVIGIIAIMISMMKNRAELVCPHRVIRVYC